MADKSFTSNQDPNESRDISNGNSGNNEESINQSYKTNTEINSTDNAQLTRRSRSKSP